MRDSIVWKRRLGRVYSSLRRIRGDNPRCGMVLTYHSVGPSMLGLPQENFRLQMDWLKANAAVVSLEQLLAGDWPDSSSGVTCAITFDDGYSSVHEYAFPILRERNFAATVYLVANAMGNGKRKSSNEFDGLYPDEDMLTWDMVCELQSGGVVAGSHLLRHKDVTSLAAAEANEELVGSKKMIEDKLGNECSSFSFPWGRYDDRSVEAVKAAGYKNSVIAIQGRWGREDELDRYRVPRADVRREYSIDDFAAVVRGDWDYLGVLQKIRRARY